MFTSPMSKSRRITLGFTLITGGLGGVPAPVPAAPAPPPDYTAEVRPILARCFKCHGPDEESRKGKLRLDLRESALKPAKSGETAIVPGDVDKSELVARIFTADEDEIMPPPSAKKPMTEADKDILKRWIAGGAEYREHWAFVPPKQVEPPVVKDTAWPRNPLDRFVLARLEKDGLAPSAEAGKHTLVRRVYLDLTGLPPTPEEADSFVNDTNPDAYGKLVDRLLASPRYGERWARRWMDLARYADTNGYEKDRNRSVWPWRDWVINALNTDQPFDRFTIEQIAGDMLPNATTDQIVATGFHRNTMLNEEGGIDPLEFRFHAMTDRVATTGTTWLGLTVGCAQCHTHKYDPIPHTEYYQMMAFLNNADEPDFDLPKAGEDGRREANLEKARRLVASLPGLFPVANEAWQSPKPAEVRAESGAKARILEDGSALFSAKAPDRETYTVVFDSDLLDVKELRLEALADASLPRKGPGLTAHGNFVLSEITVTAAPRNAPDKVRPVSLVSATADVEQPGFPAANAIDGNTATGWAVDTGAKTNSTHRATFQLARPEGFPGGTRWEVKLVQNYGGKHVIGRPRVSLATGAVKTPATEAGRKEVFAARFAEWLALARESAVDWKPLRPAGAKSNLPFLKVLPDASVLAGGDISKSDTYDLAFKGDFREVTAIRLEALPDDSLPAHGPGMAYCEGPKGDFFLGEFQAAADGKPVKLARASHSYAKNNFGDEASAALAMDGDPQTGWSAAGRFGERHVAVFVPEHPISAASLDLRMMFGRHYACSLGRFRISVTTRAGGAEASGMPDDVQKFLTVPDASLSNAQRQTLAESFLLGLPEFAKERDQVARLRQPEDHVTTLVMRERPAENPRPTFLHHRGEFLQPEKRVEPGVLSAVAPFPPELPRNRLGFAKWLVSKDNPLTARVAVNRQWQAFFGRGLVRTVDDFGFSGEAPTHPELLDWLAVEFVKQGWSLKKIHRLMVMSATYRQSSMVTPELLAKDFDNRLLTRAPRLRLEAEQIRDSFLRSSGLLSEKMGGPSVYPSQPSGVTEVAYGNRGWPVSAGEDRYRRSVYTFVKRTAPFAMFNTFDGPTGESCQAKRDTSNSPLQGLALLNDVALMEAAQALGKLLTARPGGVDERLAYGFRRVATRPPSAGEVAVLRNFFEAQSLRFQTGELDARAFTGDSSATPESAAWTAVARALLNLDEAVNRG